MQSLIHQCHLSPKYAYGVLAAFHLLPVIREELSRTRLAFRCGGISVTPFSLRPVFAMLVNTVHWSESIAMAMESKGFSGEEKRPTTMSPRYIGMIGHFLQGLLDCFSWEAFCFLYKQNVFFKFSPQSFTTLM